MTEPHHQDAGDKAPPAAQPTDNANNTVQQKLFDDLQGKYFPGNAKQENVGQLVKDGILPPGSNLIDMGTVREHLTADQAKLAELNGKAPTDPKDATAALAHAKDTQTQANAAYDAAEAKAKPVADRIDGRTQQDAQVKTDFDTVSKATGKEYLRKEDLEAVTKDQSKPQAVRDAAAHLLGTFHDVKHGRSHDSESDYSKSGFWTGKQYIDKDTIAAETKVHQAENAADQKTLAPLAADRDKAKAAKDAADGGVTTAQKNLDGITAGNKDLDQQKADTTRRIAEEQAALKPDAHLDQAGRVVKGGGYYQVAENLLGISDKAGHTTAQEKELKALTKLLQEAEKELHGGKLPAYLKQNDQLLNEENLEKVMAKLRPPTPPANDTPPT